MHENYLNLVLKENWVDLNRLLNIGQWSSLGIESISVALSLYYYTIMYELELNMILTVTENYIIPLKI